MPLKQTAADMGVTSGATGAQAVLQRAFTPEQVQSLMSSVEPAMVQARETYDQVVRDRLPVSSMQSVESALIRQATNVLDAARSVNELQEAFTEARSLTLTSVIWDPPTIAKRLAIGAGVGAGFNALAKDDVKEGAVKGMVGGVAVHLILSIIDLARVRAVTAIVADYTAE